MSEQNNKNNPTPENNMHDSIKNLKGANVPDTQDFPGENNKGINNPNIELPAFNPPVPNRAWTEMRLGKDIDALTEQEKAELYMGKDSYF